MSSYNELIDDILDEIDEKEKTANVSPESIQSYILQGCQQIAVRFPIKDQTELRLVYGVTKYNFADSTVPVTGTGTIGCTDKDVVGVTSTGTGTISTSGEDVTGVGTLFLTELSIGKMIIVGTEKKTVTSITSNLVCEIEGSFDADLSASAFSYSTTMFTKEVNVGSVIISNSISKIVETITDAYNMTVTVPYTAAQVAQAFTIDTKVTEIPTKFLRITEGSRLEGTYPRTVKISPHDKLEAQKNSDNGISSYCTLDQPAMIAEWADGGVRYLEIYPSVETDKQITLFGFIKVNPRDYNTVALTVDIPLSEDYDPIIKEYAKYRIYRKIKDEKMAAESFTLYENYIRTMITNMHVTREVSVDYN